MSNLTALIFDVDGTLADTERDGHRVAFNEAFREFGLDWDWDVELYGKLLKVTGGKERMRYYLDEFNTGYERPEDLDGFIKKLHQAKTNHFTALLARGEIPLRPGVARLIEEARAAKMRLAISTTTTPENVTALLTHTLGPDSIGWFEVIAAGDCVPAKKPANDIYVYALEQLGLAADECIAFEDSYNGVRSSLGADIKTVITVNGYTAEDDFTGAVVVLDNLGEPSAPVTVIDGAKVMNGYTYINLSCLQAMHAAAA